MVFAGRNLTTILLSELAKEQSEWHAALSTKSRAFCGNHEKPSKFLQ